MDPISVSCYTLNAEISSQKGAGSTIFGSTATIGQYEEKNFKNLIPQIIAAIIATSFHISIGISLAFSAILIPQLTEKPEFEFTESQASWIASIVALTTPVGSLVVGFFMDHFGRLKTLTFAAIPGLAGCILMALSPNVGCLIAGRALVGLSSSLGSSPAIVYLTEIARKDMRGSLISFGPALTSLGMVLTFIMGWYMPWKQVAWFTNIFILIPCVLIFFIPESPAWLVSKGRLEEAKKSLIWINRYQPQPQLTTKSVAELQLSFLQKEHELKLRQDVNRSDSGFKDMVNEFMKPTGYKPMLILTGLFFFQQFSGIFIFLFYSINFFQEVGSTSDPYFTSIFIGVVRFAMSMINTYVQKTFKRRPLLLISSFAMSFAMFCSGVSTYWIKNGTITVTWIPVICLLCFVLASMIGVIPIPYTMTAELFPLKIRGVAHSISICIASVLMFLSLQFYPTMYTMFSGICGVQFFFVSVTLLGAIFGYIFAPETQGKNLSEIEDYFWNNIVYLGQKKEEARKVVQNVRPIRARASIVRNKEHAQCLLEETDNL